MGEKIVFGAQLLRAVYAVFIRIRVLRGFPKLQNVLIACLSTTLSKDVTRLCCVSIEFVLPTIDFLNNMISGLVAIDIELWF